MSLTDNPHRPTDSQFFIKLVTESPIRKETVKKFYQTVQLSAPDGSTTMFEVLDPDNNPVHVPLVHRTLEEGKHEYEVPLVRNMTPDEIVYVVKQLESKLNEGDYLIETSTPTDEECCPEAEDIYMEPDVYEEFAERLSSRMHQKWLNERMETGWRYGEQRCDEQKTHPLIKPWNQLDEEQKAVDYEMPKFFIELLEEFGYTIISDEELNELLDK